jgi:homoserine/homoserine lactone efflux protein
MTYAALASYFLASTIFLVAPGPLMAVLIARSISRDRIGATAFAAGLCTGTLIIVLAVAMGVGIWAQGRPELLQTAKYVGVAYLMWLALGMWNSQSSFTAAHQHKGDRFASVCAGVLLCFGNPSVLLFYMLMLPTVAPTGVAGLEHLALVVVVTLVSAAAVFFGTVLLADRLNSIVASPASSGRFSRIASTMTVATAVWILAA